MLCAAITGPTILLALSQIAQALPYADLVEIRLDLFHSYNLNQIRELQTTFPKIRFLLTLRSQKEGGKCPLPENQRLQEIEKLATLNPAYLDIESFVPSSFIQSIKQKYPEIQIILSHHNFESTPDLDPILLEMQKTQADIYKISAMAHSSLDALRMLLFMKKQTVPIIGISMGELGQITRILSPLFGGKMSYAALENGSGSAPGQLSIETLTTRYRYKELNRSSGFYCLIGNPIDKSRSHQTHNRTMKLSGLNAVYVKILLHPNELKEFFYYVRELPIQGLSVTMPLKEAVMPFLDRVDLLAQEMGAVNTIYRDGEGLAGTNTDCDGALDAIEEVMKVAGKRVVIIGAGGAAKAVAYEACRRGAKVTVLNRNEEKAIALAAHLGCRGGGLDEMNELAREGYDLLINATPDPLPIDSKDILAGTVVMDLSIQPDNAFVKIAEEKGCGVIYGFRMFELQAEGQFALWFH